MSSLQLCLKKSSHPIAGTIYHDFPPPSFFFNWEKFVLELNWFWKFYSLVSSLYWKANPLQASHSRQNWQIFGHEKKNVVPGGIRTQDLSFTAYISNREVPGSNPSGGQSIFRSCLKICYLFLLCIPWLAHCLKITQNVAFEFLDFGIFHQFMSY